MTLAIGGVLAITSGRKQRHGAEGGEEKEVPFRLLSAEEKAIELRRQRRSSAAPVAGPFAAHSSFRRDDRIHTDFRAHVLDTASEMAAGEHLAAAYRLRDSVGANATLAAGLRRFSHAAGKAPGGGAFCRTSSAACAPTPSRPAPTNRARGTSSCSTSPSRRASGTSTGC